MGTHPIFESDFDCLTEKNVAPGDDAEQEVLGYSQGGRSVQLEASGQGREGVPDLQMEPRRWWTATNGDLQSQHEQKRDRPYSYFPTFLPRRYLRILRYEHRRR